MTSSTLQSGVVADVATIAARWPDQPAVVTDAAIRTYSWLMAQAEDWTARFRRLALPPRSVITILSRSEESMPPAWLGVRLAGHVPALVDAAAGRARVDALVDAARPGAVVRLADASVEASRAPAAGLSEGAGYVAFSSGSQGSPKVIVGSEAGLRRFLAWETDLVDSAPGTRCGAVTSPSFDVVLRDMLLPLVSGAALVLAPPSIRFSAARVIPWLAHQGVHVLHAVPSLSQQWMGASTAHLPDLRCTLFAGEPLHSRHVTAWTNRAPATRVINLYGPAETTLATFWHEVAQPPPEGAQPVGQPLPGTRVDFDPIVAAPAGDRGGRIVLSTPFGSLGYLAGTAAPEQVLSLVREDDVTTFITQDRGYLDTARDLVVAGRLDTLVKRRGTFVDTGLIELAAIAQPEVSAACCLSRPLDSSVVLFAETGLAGDEVARRLRAELHTGRPDAVVVLPRLPRLPAGKVDRQALYARLESDEPTRSHHIDEPDRELTLDRQVR